MSLIRYYNPVTDRYEVADSGAIDNDKGLRYTPEDVKKIEESVPTKTSQLDNDSGYITENDIPDADLTEVEKLSNKNKAGGYAGLDGVGQIPLKLLPDVSKQQNFIVSTYDELLETTPNEADGGYVLSTGDSYIYTGDKWEVWSKAEWENINLDWANLVNAPTSTQAEIDKAVSQSHTHSNKAELDKIKAGFTDGITQHTNDMNIHTTAVEKERWNKKADISDLPTKFVHVGKEAPSNQQMLWVDTK